MDNYIQSVIEEKRNILNKLETSDFKNQLRKISLKIAETLKENNKLLIAGNGGSAADAQHFAAELVGRFEVERRGLPAIALTTDTSILTCVGNDYNFDNIFERQIEALANPKDVFVGISTSGNSSNIIKAVESAKRRGAYTIGFLGKDGGKLKNLCDSSIIIPSNTTARVQEIHEMCIHVICAYVDNGFKE